MTQQSDRPPGVPASALGRWLIFACGVLPTSFFVATQTVANAALPQMQGDLAAGLDEISWIVTASVVAGAIAIPPTSWLTSRFGRRRLFMSAMFFSSLATVMVGFAGGLGEVVLWRVLAALCAGPSIAMSQALTLDLFSEEERGTAFAAWALGILSGWIMAPTVGAFIAENYGWRVIFWSFGPMGILSVFLASRLPDTARDVGMRFDWIGYFLLAMTISGFLLMLNRGPRLDWFESQEIVIWTSIGTVSIYLFIVHSTTTTIALLDWRVFKDRNYALGIPLILIYASLSLAPLVLIPSMLKLVKGVELLTTGMALIPRGLAQMAGLVLVGAFYRHFDPRLLIGAGLLMYCVAGLRMSAFNTDIGLADVMWPNLMQGFAMALAWVPIANLVYGNLQGHLKSHGTTISSLCYSLASSVGVSISIIVLNRSTQINRSELVQNIRHTNELLDYPALARSFDVNSLASLQGLNAIIERQASMIGYNNAYLMLALVSLLAIPLALAMRKPG